MKTLQLLAVAILFTSVTYAATAQTTKKNTQTVSGNLSLKTTMSNTHVLLPGSKLLQIAIDIEASAKAQAQRLPMNLALVIDRSGSMRGEKMTYTLQAAMHLVRQLGENDTLSIVSYSDEVRIDLRAQRVSGEVRQDAIAAIERIRAGGSTNLSGGLMQGQNEVQRYLKSGQVNRVILMSDGLANRGITNTKQLAQKAQQGAQRGISVTTMGVGIDYNEDLMTSVADHASGNYYFIESAGHIARVFSAELTKMFSTVAQATEVTLRLADGIALQQVYGYAYQRQGDRITIPLAEMFARQKRSILIGLRVSTIREGHAKVADVRLRYEDVGRDSQQITANVDLAVQITKDKALVDAGQDKSVQERIEEIRVAEVMNKAADLLKNGQRIEAQRLLRMQRKKSADRAKSLGGSGRISNQVRQLDALGRAFEARGEASGAMVKKTKAAARKQSR